MASGNAGKPGTAASTASYTRRLEREIAAQTAELVEARNAAVAADRARTAFFAAVSHDLRTPIHGVLAAADQLPDATAADSADLIATIRGSANELLERLDELLALAQPPDNANLHPINARIPDVVNHALEAYHRLFPPGRGWVNVDLDDSLDQEVLLQRAGLLRVVDALFAEFMLLPAPEQVTLAMSLADHWLIMEVRGLGARGSTGAWGLVEQAVAAVDGEIRAVPSAGDRPAVIAIPATPVEHHRIVRSQRVLLVDDTAVTRQLGQGMVRSLGYDVDTADGGYAAIQAVSTQPYGLVLMDIRMPDLDGISATRAIRAGDAGPDCSDVPIVALTAHAVAGAREEALMAGMDDFVTKPFTRQSLAATIERFLGHVEPAGQASASA